MTSSRPELAKSTVRRRIGAGIFVVAFTLVLGSGGALRVAEQVGSKVAEAARSLTDSETGQKHPNPEMALVQALLSPVPSSDPTVPFTPSAGAVLAAAEPVEVVGGISGEAERLPAADEAESLPEAAVEAPPVEVPVERPGNGPRDEAPPQATEPIPQPVAGNPPAIPVDVPVDVPPKPVGPADPPPAAPLLPPAQPGEKTVLRAPPAGVSNLLPEAARLAQQGRPAVEPRDAGTGSGAKGGPTERRR